MGTFSGVGPEIAALLTDIGEVMEFLFRGLSMDDRMLFLLS